MKRQPATLLVGETGLQTEALFLPAPGGLCCQPMADHLPRLVIPRGPTTQPQDGTLRLACAMDVLDREPAAWGETRPQGIEAQGRAGPRRRRARGRAAGVGPARLRPRGVPCRPGARAVAPHAPRRPRQAPLAPPRDHGAGERCRPVAWRGLTPPPGPWQGTPLRDDMEHERGTPAAPAAAIPDEPHRRPSARTPPALHRGQTVDRLQAMGVVAPPRQALDAARGLGALGARRGEVGQWGALAAHDAAEQRRQGVEMAGTVPEGRGGEPGASAGRRARERRRVSRSVYSCKGVALSRGSRRGVNLLNDHGIIT
jgi:hypothetical protein